MKIRTMDIVTSSGKNIIGPTQHRSTSVRHVGFES
jgi:hypothetical protein